MRNSKIVKASIILLVSVFIVLAGVIYYVPSVKLEFRNVDSDELIYNQVVLIFKYALCSESPCPLNDELVASGYSNQLKIPLSMSWELNNQDDMGNAIYKIKLISVGDLLASSSKYHYPKYKRVEEELNEKSNVLYYEEIAQIS